MTDGTDGTEVEVREVCRHEVSPVHLVSRQRQPGNVVGNIASELDAQRAVAHADDVLGRYRYAP